MKANELMIGDWVVYDGDVEYQNPIRVEGMDISGYSLITSDRDDVGFDGVQPIPLTPEILEKNGFEDVGSEVYECDVLPFYIWLERDRHRLGIDIEDSTYDKENFAQMLRVPVSYVHDLQHALRLCGIEKEIEL